MTDSSNLDGSGAGSHQEALAYLVGLYSETPQGLLWIGGHADGWRGKTFTAPDDAARYAMELDARGGAGVYHRSTTLAQRPEKRGGAEDSWMVHYFALDGDVRGPGHKAGNLPSGRDDLEALIEVTGFPAPTLWVASGGGFYPQWRFHEPIDVRDPETRAWVTEAFAQMSAHFLACADERGWKLDNVRDLARVFRLPGTTNRKVLDMPVTARVLGAEGERHDMGALVGIVRRATRPAVPAAPVTTGDDLFDDATGDDERRFTREQATEFVKRARARLLENRQGWNAEINNFAMACAHFPWLVDRDLCARLMIKTVRPVTGWSEPNQQDSTTIDSAYRATEAGKSWVAIEVKSGPSVDMSVRADTGLPRLKVTSAADMTYWLAAEIGRGRLAGFFLRDSRVVHTPRVNEIGYVPAPDGGDNGPAEIRPVSADEVAAKLQFLYACYKVTKEEGEKAALFPVDAARRVVNAPESASGLRALRGITLTPMVRGDGTVLDTPGYDKDSGYLFLPGPGVNVRSVPDEPSREDVQLSVALLSRMVAGFPFDSDDDRANYFGLLLTPLLRLLTPPSYKLFGIGAHQPGSGKSLLAQVVSEIHGGVLRSEVPQDEAEWGKQIGSILSATSAPVVVLDNVTGVLKSSALAGMLTAGGELSQRELGKNANITYTNDRVWVVTGNNLSLGGDLVRRTITVMIDPDSPNPEQRTEFDIPDLAGWVREHRNELLWALLVLVRNWVMRGVPERRAQSDSYARWESAVGGILAAAGVPGRFDAESGRRAAGGGDDDGLVSVLEHLASAYPDRSFSVAEALALSSDMFASDQRDWVPGVVLDRLARSEPAGRKTFGHWLRNRLGRWVTGSDDRAYVIREAGREHNTARWRIEVRG